MIVTDFFLNLLSGGIVGGVASFVASTYFLKHNNINHRPSIKISDKLIKTTRDDGTPALLIKVINETDEDIADIVFEVEGINNLSPAGSIPLLNLTLLGRREILYIQKFNDNDTNAHYAHRTKLFKKDDNIIEESAKYETIRVSIRATCPYYGTSVITSRDYNFTEDVLSERHTFNTGNSLSCSSQ